MQRTFRLYNTKIGTDDSFEYVDIRNIGYIEVKIGGRASLGTLEAEADVTHDGQGVRG